MTHVLSLGALRGRQADSALAEQALRSIDREFGDPTYGGWFRVVAPDGVPQPDKTAYEHAFILLAASSALVAGVAGAAALLDHGMATILDHFWDEDAGRLVESWSRDWSQAEAYRGANANMHAVEAFLATADATGDDQWRHRADRIGRAIASSAESNDWLIPEHFDSQWRVLPDYNRDHLRHPFRPFGATPGHAFEWARLLVQLGASHVGSQQWTVPAAAALFARASESWDDERGGFPYTTDWTGAAVVSERLHWVHCEALAAAVALWRVTGDAAYADWYARIWDYTWPRFPDHVRGGWWHELDPAGEVSRGTWSGKPDTYHAVQSCLFPMLPIDVGFARGVDDPRALPGGR